MAVKKFKPTTPSLRKMVVLSSEGLTKTVKPLKGLMEKKTKTAGTEKPLHQYHHQFLRMYY